MSTVSRVHFVDFTVYNVYINILGNEENSRYVNKLNCVTSHLTSRMSKSFIPFNPLPHYERGGKYVSSFFVDRRLCKDHITLMTPAFEIFVFITVP